MPMNRYVWSSDPYLNTSWHLGRKLGVFFPPPLRAPGSRLGTSLRNFSFPFPQVVLFTHSKREFSGFDGVLGQQDHLREVRREALRVWTLSMFNLIGFPKFQLPYPTPTTYLCCSENLHSTPCKQTSDASTFLAQVYQGNLPHMKSWWIRTQAVDQTGLVHNSTLHFQLGKLELVFLTSPCLIFFICKMGIRIVCTSQGQYKVS